MRKRKRGVPVSTLGLTAGALFVIEAALVGAGRMAAFDNAIFERTRAMIGHGMTAVMKLFTYLGSGAVVAGLAIGIAVYLYAGLRERRETGLFVLTLAGAGLLNYGLKLMFDRTRPDGYRLIEIEGLSFPSGHAMTAFTLYGLLVYLLYRRQRLLWQRVCLIGGGVLLTLLIGFSRIYLGVHYPSDVVGGYLAGCAWLCLAIWLYGLWYKPAPSTVKS